MLARLVVSTFSNVRTSPSVLKPIAIKPLSILPVQNYSRPFHSSGGAVQGFEEFYDPILSADKAISTGRAWTAVELRRKSFEDLQKLWYVLYKERNLLLTTKLRSRRALNPPSPEDESRYIKVKRSMASIKRVIGERKKIDAMIKAQESGQGTTSDSEAK